MESKSKEKKQIDLAINRAYEKEKRKGHLYFSSFGYSEGFKAGIEYQKNIESDGKELTAQEINDGFVQNVSCRKCNDRGIIYNDNGCFSNVCKCHY